jgi:hypothetical protein
MLLYGLPMSDLSVIERAFQLAKSGEVRSVDEVRLVLSREGYASVQQSIGGMATRKQLKALITQARR